MLELDILENRLDDEVTGSKIGHVLGCDDAAQDRISLFGCPAFPCDLLVQNPLTIGLALQIGRAHSELQSLMRISYAVFCLKKQQTTDNIAVIKLKQTHKT